MCVPAANELTLWMKHLCVYKNKCSSNDETKAASPTYFIGVIGATPLNWSSEQCDISSMSQWPRVFLMNDEQLGYKTKKRRTLQFHTPWWLAPPSGQTVHWSLRSNLSINKISACLWIILQKQLKRGGNYSSEHSLHFNRKKKMKTLTTCIPLTVLVFLIFFVEILTFIGRKPDLQRFHPNSKMKCWRDLLKIQGMRVKCVESQPWPRNKIHPFLKFHLTKRSSIGKTRRTDNLDKLVELTHLYYDSSPKSLVLINSKM